MMRGAIVLATLIAVQVGPLAAQNPQVRRQMLQQQVVERFMANYRAQAGLTDEQGRRLEDMTRRSFEARTALALRERTLWFALEGQMRPGVAANADSVAKLIDDLLALESERVERARAEQREFATFLSPVQRAQLTLAWRRLQMQIERVRGGQGRGPGVQGR
jgi:hypothetical protein